MLRSRDLIRCADPAFQGEEFEKGHQFRSHLCALFYDTLHIIINAAEPSPPGLFDVFLRPIPDPVASKWLRLLGLDTWLHNLDAENKRRQRQRINFRAALVSAQRVSSRAFRT